MSYNATAQFLGMTDSGSMSYPMTPVALETPANTYSTDNMIMAQQPSYYVSPDERLKNNIADNGMADPNARIEYMKKSPGTYKPKNSDIKGKDTGGGTTSAKPKYTEEQVFMYGRAASYLVDAANNFANAALAPGNAKLKSESYNFSAAQNERMAKLLEKNITDINRAAQMDANIYKMQAVDARSKQKTAMSATGFAVGKGSYKTTLATTDARTNYNIAMRMLKADLQTAETTRKAGTYRAQAAIERGNANIATIKGREEMWKGIIGGVGSLINSGFSFYMGEWGLEGSTSTSTKTAKGTGGKK